MALNWNEIKTRAVAFSKEWEEERNEKAEAKTFWDKFFTVFGMERRRLAAFESHVKKLDNKDGYIDLFWPGVLIVEHKSGGRDLDKAYQQAIDYFPGLENNELPKYILVSDFQNFELHDLEEKTKHAFSLKELKNNVRLFGFIAGYEKQIIRRQDPINIKAAELMAALHDEIRQIGYDGHQLEVFLVRTLFCLFADDTGIFQTNEQFWNYIEWRTKVDGSDLGLHLSILFQILNTAEDKRQTTLDEDLAKFPYVNGGLFAENLPVVSFDSSMRKALLKCCEFDWSNISPAIFGSMFQGVMDKDQRRSLGAHYTSETNILKVIKPLFLDELWQEFEIIKNNNSKLQIFQQKIADLKFLDPACGCGNFLVISYRELRLLELEVLKILYQSGKSIVQFNIKNITKVSPEQFYGIEIEEFPARIAETAIWLVDHQMNQLASQALGQYFVRLPLDQAAHITIGNALNTDWAVVIPKNDLNYILGNPPFIGSKLMSEQQRKEIEEVFSNTKGVGVLDYVTGWYIKAAKYIQNTNINCAFVSTNSITQGEQAGILWETLIVENHVQINFAHRTFKWSNEAKGKAGVFCVIIGFGLNDSKRKIIFDYINAEGDSHVIAAKNINPYLVDAPNIYLKSRQKPICDSPEIGIGNKPIDGGFYLFTPKEKDNFLKKEPLAEKFFRKWVGGEEFLNGIERWCLFLKYAQPDELKRMPEVLKRIEEVKNFRLASKSKPTVKLAQTPTKFHVENIPSKSYLVIPEVNPDTRRYIPIAYVSPDVLASNLVKIVANASLYHFAILQSQMHMSWVRGVCGRLGNGLRYSKDIVYNNFPWPEDLSSEKLKQLELAAQNILNIRNNYPNSSLAILYDPLTMPEDLGKAHDQLNKLVDSAYTKRIFLNEADRLQFLFELYEKYISRITK